MCWSVFVISVKGTMPVTTSVTETYTTLAINSEPIMPSGISRCGFSVSSASDVTCNETRATASPHIVAARDVTAAAYHVKTCNTGHQQ